MPKSIRATAAVLVGASLSLALGCKGSVDVEDLFYRDVPTPNIQITILSGDNQNVPAGSEFPQPVVVRVVRDGQPYANWAVIFTMTVPAALPLNQPVNSPTDADGRASIRVRMGTLPGPFSLRIYYPHCPRPAILPKGDSCGSPIIELGSVTAHGTVVSGTP